jgi:hypothetical protein
VVGPPRLLSSATTVPPNLDHRLPPELDLDLQSPMQPTESELNNEADRRSPTTGLMQAVAMLQAHGLDHARPPPSGADEPPTFDLPHLLAVLVLTRWPLCQKLEQGR